MICRIYNLFVPALQYAFRLSCKYQYQTTSPEFSPELALVMVKGIDPWLETHTCREKLHEKEKLGSECFCIKW